MSRFILCQEDVDSTITKNALNLPSTANKVRLQSRYSVGRYWEILQYLNQSGGRNVGTVFNGIRGPGIRRFYYISKHSIKIFDVFCNSHFDIIFIVS